MEKKVKCDICSNESEAEEALEAEEKIEELKEKQDTGQHPVSKEEYKLVENHEDWEESDVQ